MEPECKQMLKDIGISVPKFRVVTEWEEALGAADDIGYPLVCKVVSPAVIHKSDSGGVMVGIDNRRKLKSAYQKLKQLDGFRSMLIEETVEGVELIVGAKNDYQFGPVIMTGIGGTGVEIYQDSSIRMAPITSKNIESMLRELKAYQLLEGYRGSTPVNLKRIKDLLLSFSDLVLELEDVFESIDLNPVMCSQQACVVADARIMLNSSKR
jgi:acyl-CoA synthetase (NDP forming)